MSLNARLIAIQGIGFTPVQIAVQGLLDTVVAVEAAPARQPASYGSISSGPDAHVSMADYLRRFGKSTASQPQALAQPLAVSLPSNAIAQRTALQRKRQRREEEIFALMEF